MDQERRPIIGNNIVILHVKQVRIIKAIIVIMDEGLRHLRLFAACTFVEEELLSIVG